MWRYLKIVFLGGFFENGMRGIEDKTKYFFSLLFDFVRKRVRETTLPSPKKKERTEVCFFSEGCGSQRHRKVMLKNHNEKA